MNKCLSPIYYIAIHYRIHLVTLDYSAFSSQHLKKIATLLYYGYLSYFFILINVQCTLHCQESFLLVKNFNLRFFLSIKIICENYHFGDKWKSQKPLWAYNTFQIMHYVPRRHSVIKKKVWKHLWICHCRHNYLISHSDYRSM